MISGSWAWSACRWASAVVGFLGSQAVFSAVLFAVVLPLTLICGRRCRLLAAGLWTLVFVRLLLPADLAAPFSGRMLIESVLKQPEAATSTVSAPVPEAGKPARQPAVFHAEAGAETRERAVRPLHAVLFFAWLSGLIAAGAAYTTRLRKYKDIARDAESCGDVRLLEVLGKWQTLFRVRRQVRLAFGPCRISPYTVGILRPVIVLPGCMRLSDPERTIEPVIAHEMAHVRHWDDLWIRLQNLVQIIYFFNPIVWLAGRQVHQLREESRDASVLEKRSISGRLYGNALLETVRMRLEPSDDLVLLPRFADEKTRLIRRLRHIQRPAFLRKGAGRVLAGGFVGFRDAGASHGEARGRGSRCRNPARSAGAGRRSHPAMRPGLGRERLVRSSRRGHRKRRKTLHGSGRGRGTGDLMRNGRNIHAIPRGHGRSRPGMAHALPTHPMPGRPARRIHRKGTGHRTDEVLPALRGFEARNRPGSGIVTHPPQAADAKSRQILIPSAGSDGFRMQERDFF